MTQSTPTQTLAELMDRINGRLYDAGMTLAVEKNAEAIMENAEMIYQVTAGIHVKEAFIDTAKINQAQADHIRQIVREEIRQFVTRESGRGGLFSKW
ncbi:hypothetical protein [Xenorhabdus bovienii]|uniref:Uncharacterized protein n=1 Tax=Xenorhabdus bovienii str. Intermedium TaxID=1379677 RepID=A0A077QHL1_XENBV|nr:hypothetical protein [Xenorhabdus bovienii]MDE9483853.1 hypothetical protein [Xenorhabdus bovienii]CDH32994.1 conserved hypothetical protein [Xenorhabdus bovienii str. Intermedium]